MEEFEFDENFEEWFNREILPEISPTMVLVAKSLMAKGWDAGYLFGVDVGCEISHR
ncbi:hypothetical protein CPT_Metamorpho_289 [Klebsiella phage Metamorpho]|nr:hypothetical protein CPT_Metamorpho_289 [Klebsiella phage Metamorpho]